MAGTATVPGARWLCDGLQLRLSSIGRVFESHLELCLLLWVFALGGNVPQELCSRQFSQQSLASSDFCYLFLSVTGLVTQTILEDSEL